MGMSTAEWSAYISEDFGVPLPAPRVAELVIADMAAEYQAHLPLLPGAVDAVRDLSARWPLAVAMRLKPAPVAIWVTGPLSPGNVMSAGVALVP